MGTITKTFEIDQIAQRAFKNALPAKWLIRQQNPDVHIDYFVEVVESTEPTGLVFGAQLKGTGSPKYTEKYIRFSFEKKHLAYYLDKVKQPIFLIVVDVNTGAGFWIFAQAVIKNPMTPNWRHKKKIGIRIPLINKLENTVELLKEIRRADAFMRELWPGSIAAAAKQEQQKLMELDSRFHVNVKYDRGITRYELCPKENLSGKIIIKNNTDALNKMNDLIKRGKPVLFEPGQFSITGSKLLDDISVNFATHGVRVEASKTLKCDAEIAILNPQNEVIHAILGIKAEMKGGTEEVDIDLVLPNSPLSMRFRRGLNLRDKPKSADMTLTLNLENWSGQPLLLLPYFEQTYRFAQLIEIGNKIRLSFDVQGNKLFHGITNITEQLFFIRSSLPYLVVLENARFISRKLNISPHVPKLENITQNDADLFAAIRTIIETGEYRQDYAGHRASAAMILDENILSMIRGGTYPEGTVRIYQAEASVFVFGHKLDNLLLSHALTNAKLTQETKEKLIHANSGEEIELEWEGLVGSERIITRITVGGEAPV